MLIPSTLFFFVLNSRGLSEYPIINMHSIVRKRIWRDKSPEEKAKFCAMRSKVQKKTYANLSKADKKAVSLRFSKGMQKFWDNVSEEDKDAHIGKMSVGMKKAWDEGDEKFGPRVANRENHKRLYGDFKIEKDIPRINDYSGVVTMSDMRTL